MHIPHVVGGGIVVVVFVTMDAKVAIGELNQAPGVVSQSKICILAPGDTQCGKAADKIVCNSWLAHFGVPSFPGSVDAG